MSTTKLNKLHLNWTNYFVRIGSLCYLSPDGVKTFTQFLRTEFSEENIEFWLACEDYKTTESNTKLLSKAKQIYAVFIENDSPKEVTGSLYHPLFITAHCSLVTAV